MEKNLKITLIVAALVFTICICIFGIMDTCRVLFYIGIVFFIIGLLKILNDALREAVNSYKRN